ncbi:MAG: hypothetical protein JXC32_06850, partial [Anaerolineae bacterium]|nr:hypothetical protein [Anaerolineae bacterium]
DDCTMQSAVSIDVYDDTGHALTLHPGDTLTIEYRAVPILYQGMPEVHAIGATPVTVNYLAEGTGHLGTFARPCVLVGDETLSDAVTAHRAASDYLIITNPRALFADNPRRSDVDVLLSAVADLASLKSGILGYLTYSASWSGVDATIDAWGRGMRSSDGTPGDYLHDGYLLIVGEIEIVAAATLTAGALYNIPLSDALYADTYANMTDPELMVGRIIGNNALELLIPVNTILSLHRGTAGYGFDRSHAFVMSGFDMGRSGESDDIDMDQERWDVTWYLEADGTTVTQLDTADYAISRTLSVAAIIASLPDQDIVHIAGHGSPWHIDDLAEWDLTPHLDPFGSASPFVYGSACLSGRYALSYDRPIVTGLAERFLRCGAAAYLGSTQVSYDPANRNIAGSIYAHWDSGRSIGSVVKEVKISRGTGAWWWQEDYWAMAYQLFGDPQLGLDVYIAPSAMPALQPQPAGVPPTITVAIPDYQIDQYEDGDIQVRIPDGFWLQVPGQPMVPTYDSTLPIPAGERVQDVVLASRSGLSTTTGLEIPSYDPKVAGPAALADVAPPDDVAWWPDRDFEWHVSDNADGSSELLIRITPFFYNPLTTDVRFYRDYAFAIETAPSTVQIVRLETDQDAYAPNTPVAIALASHNSAAEEDITVSAMIKALGSGEVAGGLPLRSLKALSGLGTLSLAWNTAAHPAGDYVLEVEIRDATGELLDRALTNFKVGILSIATANWTVLPAIFRPGDDITLSFDAQNTGTHAITATAVIEVLSPTSGTVALFSQEIVDLAPGGGVPVTASWDTPAAPETFYAVTAYVQYDSTTTPLLTATLRPWQRCFLPVVTR